MRWKTNEPKLGDTKAEIRMAWLPTELSDGYTVWLETYRVYLRYERRMVPTKAFTTIARIRWFEIKTEALGIFGV